MDGYKEIDQNKDTALKITDNLDSSLFVYYFSKAYKNSLGDTIVALFVYYPQTNSIMRIYAEKVDKNNNSQFYYDSLENQSESSEVSSKLALKANSNFDTRSFLCGLTSTVACTSFSAMLFAFLPASIAVGATCSAAFAYVCSYN